MKLPSTNLVHVLIGKSILETILIGALAVIAFLTVLPPYFQGWGEVTDDGVAGWAVNKMTTGERVELQLFVDGQFFATQVADRSRPDVPAAGWASDEWHGYSFVIKSVAAGPHEARIYALRGGGDVARKSLQLVGKPLSFIAGSDGKLRAPAADK